MYDLKEMANLASEILDNSKIQYLSNKNLIMNLFKKTKGNNNDIIFRLTLIDSFYSTNMSKTLYGIENIANKIEEVSSYDDLVVEYCKNFMEIGDDVSVDKISKLFNGKYGFNKGELIESINKEDLTVYGNHAFSLISKYLYFLTDFEFPIYDSLAKKSYNQIYDKITDKVTLEKMNKQFNINYFKQIKNLKQAFNIENYNKLDNLLWLIGKINKGSYSLILPEIDYVKLITKIHQYEPFLNYKSDKVDNHISTKLKDKIDIIDDIEINKDMNGKLRDFVEFVYDLKK